MCVVTTGVCLFLLFTSQRYRALARVKHYVSCFFFLHLSLCRENLLTIIITTVKVKVVFLRVAIAFNLAVKQLSRFAKRAETPDTRLLCADANTLFNPFALTKSRRGDRETGENVSYFLLQSRCGKK